MAGQTQLPARGQPSTHLPPGDEQLAEVLAGCRGLPARLEHLLRQQQRHFGTLEGGVYGNQEEADITRGHREPSPLLKEQGR